MPSPWPAFVKVEGLGNDFVLVDGRGDDEAALVERLQHLAPRICDRRTGVGADGVLIVGAGSGRAQAKMIVVNADGSRPQMCGNGLRCVALWLAHHEGRSEWIVDTDAGLRGCLVDGAQVTVDMGPAARLGSVRPGPANGRSFAQVSMGNPHAIAFVERGEDPEVMARVLGPLIERDDDFPEGTNVELARIEADGRITLWVWERGCGITAACGTGACATVAAAVDAELAPADAPVTVVLPGGALEITVPSAIAAGVKMSGPARLVFDGRWPSGS
ncbi:MAG TPA: diaminopimelate epimerase [Nannocystaceae bacterium]|nr:diaminopimelate epimerase [Nannocystaceae bacterium]